MVTGCRKLCGTSDDVTGRVSSVGCGRLLGVLYYDERTNEYEYGFRVSS